MRTNNDIDVVYFMLASCRDRISKHGAVDAVDLAMSLDIPERQLLARYEDDGVPWHHRALFHRLSGATWVWATTPRSRCTTAPSRSIPQFLRSTRLHLDNMAFRCLRRSLGKIRKESESSIKSFLKMKYLTDEVQLIQFGNSFTKAG